MKYKCIYCLNEKDKKDFNREHVMSQMMGKYENNLVLGKHQVCEECNSFFSKQLENNISLDSYEGFLRMQYGKANPMSDGRKLQRKHVIVKADSGDIKGLSFTPIVNSNNQENISLETVLSIGILENDTGDKKYTFYEINSLPVATPEVITYLQGKENGIITAGISKDDAWPILKEKGYVNEKSVYKETELPELLNDTVLNTRITYTEDSKIRRVWAKIIFNYLCYYAGSEYVLDERFNAFREFIRYGSGAEKIKFKKENGPISTAEVPNERSHVVGTMIKAENGCWSLYGHITIFGESTYIFKIAEMGIPISIVRDLAMGIQVLDIHNAPETKMAIFDNETRKITEDNSYQIYGNLS